MKKILLIALLGSAFFVASAQTLAEKEKEVEKAKAAVEAATAALKKVESEFEALKPFVAWKKGGFSSLNYNSLGLTNWAAGGVSSNAVSASIGLFGNYAKDKLSWTNSLDLAYGLIQNRGQAFRKNEDRIDFTSVVGRQLSPKLDLATRINLLTQFAPGYDYTNTALTDKERPVISQFFAPAFAIASLGVNYKPIKPLSVYLSPATGKFTIVLDDTIAAKNIYIPNTLNKDGVQFYSNNYRAEFGALFNALFEQAIGKRLAYKSNLNLFWNYTDVNTENRENVDVAWINEFNIKVTEYIGARVFTHLIHDNDIQVPLYENGVATGATGPRTQFMRVFGIGFSKKF